MNDLTNIPAAACPRCGGWTVMGGMSQYGKSIFPVQGRTGCSCDGNLKREIAEQVASLTVDDVMQVYSGRPGCGCGCRGKYHSNPRYKEVNDRSRGYVMDNASLRSCQIQLAKLQAAAERGETIEVGAIRDREWPQVCFSYETETRYLWVYAVDWTQDDRIEQLATNARQRGQVAWPIEG